MAQSAPPRGQATSAAQDIKQKATEQFERMADRATDQFKNIADQAEQVVDQGHVVGQRVQQAAENFKGAVDKSVKTQPVMTLMVAAAVGFVLGALWKS
jgi:ElaB/YqjD/DUF883 family membrane-anchored ribosome-binding protein